MMCTLKIYVDSLKHQDNISIDEELYSSFLNIIEKDLKIIYPVHVKGKAYLSSDYLIVNFSAKTYFEMPCRICSKNLLSPLETKNSYKAIDYNKIKNRVYDFSNDLREALLLKLPHFVECENGACPERKNIKKYLKNTSKKTDEKHFPFEKIFKEK